jgi:uncharacterized membrane protein
LVLLVVILALVFVIAIPALALSAFARTGSLRADLDSFRAEVAALRVLLERQTRTEPSFDAAASPEAAEAPPPAAPVPVQPTAGETNHTGSAPAIPIDPPHGETFEERFTLRWSVWVGGLALALGGIFLVKFSIEQGLLGPTARVSLGVVIGLMLTALGERVRRHPIDRLQFSYIPIALAFAGIVTIFASVYVAYALYDLLPPLLAFALLAGVAAGSVALSILQGPLLAFVGVSGALLVPALVSTDKPEAWALFPYLLAAIAGGYAVARLMAWSALAWLVLAGATAWPLIWFIGGWQAGDAVVVGPYLLLTAALYLLIPLPARTGALDTQKTFAESLVPALRYPLALTAALATALLVFILVRVDSYGTVSLTAAAMLTFLYFFAARREAFLDVVALVAAVLIVAFVAAWHVPQIVPELQLGKVPIAPEVGFTPGPIVPPELTEFLWVAAAFAAFVGIAGFLLRRGAARPGLWAAISAATPIVLLFVAYVEVKRFDLSPPWAAIGLGLALINFLAVRAVVGRRAIQVSQSALAAYAVAVVAAISLSAMMMLDAAWLTVALALQLPALGWVHERTRVPALRWVAIVVALAVTVRLALNPYVFSYRYDPAPIFNWLLYGYGIPALACFLAARWFRRIADDRLVQLLEGISLVFVFLLFSLEIRHFVNGGRLWGADGGLLEQSLRSIAWGAIACALQRINRIAPRPVPFWGARIVGGIAALHVLIMHIFVSNPLLTGAPVGSTPVFNQLALAYLLPALLAMVFCREALMGGERVLAIVAGALALLLGFAEVSMELRHAFHGSIISFGPTSSFEWYCYSVVWLAYGGVLLLIGILRGWVPLRYASLGFIVLAVVKVFVFDMSALTGLYRAASFFGLGICLLALGYLYQRFVFPRHATRD